MIALVVDVARAAILYRFTLFFIDNNLNIAKKNDNLWGGPYVAASNWCLTVFFMTVSVAYWVFSFKYLVIAS